MTFLDLTDEQVANLSEQNKKLLDNDILRQVHNKSNQLVRAKKNLEKKGERHYGNAVEIQRLEMERKELLAQLGHIRAI